VLELGVNDIIRGIPPQTTFQNLQAIIDRVKLKYPGIKMLMMGMEIPAFIPGAFAANFKAIFRKLADANQMACVPFYLDDVAGKAHLNLADMLHPNAAGYQVMADKIWPDLKKLL
jgi:acyl-CoA thioesterase-1